MPRLQQRLDVADRVQSTTLGSIRVLLGQQVCLEDRLQDQHCRHLRHAILDRWDPQGSLFAVGFGNPYPTHRRGTIRFVLQLLLEFAKPSVQSVLLDVLERLAVYSCRSLIGETAFVGVRQNVRAIHLVVQGIKPVAGRSLRFGM
jgi:hypothetical protein